MEEAKDSHDEATALLKDLNEFVCKSTPEQFSPDHAMYENGDELAPFFTESHLYNLLDKSDARRLLGRWEQLGEAITTALAAREREVWESVTKEFDTKFMASDARLDRSRDYRVDEFYAWCRRQGAAPLELL